MSPDTEVKVLHRGETGNIEEQEAWPAGAWRWNHVGDRSDIVAYSVVAKSTDKQIDSGADHFIDGAAVSAAAFDAAFGATPVYEKAYAAGAFTDRAEVSEQVVQIAGLASALKDSGERRKTDTGAVRDRASGKGRFDLLPLFGMLATAMQMERGTAKYSERNWEKGMPLSWFADAALRHFVKFIVGFDDEPHLDAALWNMNCLAEGRERIKRGLWPAEFDDLPKTFAGMSPDF